MQILNEFGKQLQGLYPLLALFFVAGSSEIIFLLSEKESRKKDK